MNEITVNPKAPATEGAALWDWPGSRWWRCDLHIHSPASYDFAQPAKASNLAVVGAASNNGLHAIGVTDHNTPEAVEEITRLGASLTTPLAVFPGVEITTSEGAHLIVLFEPGTRADVIKGLLGSCGVNAKLWGKREAIADCNYSDCISKAAEIDGAICIAAHADRAASGGKNETSLLYVLRAGQPLNAVLELSSLHAAETTTNDATALKKLRGKDPRTGRALRPCVRFSDAHDLNQIGRDSTWMKMTRPDGEGLRLALADGETSLLPHEEGADPNSHSSVVVESITISEAKLIGRGQPFELRMNPWLNTIIGGRGTGKSSVIEFLRLALRRDDELPSALAATFKDLARVPETSSDKGLLRTNTRISVIYRKDGTRFRITWPHSAPLSPIEEEQADGTWIEAEGDVAQRFPIRIYSQKQVFELAEGPEALLKVVDDSAHVRKSDWDREWREAETSFLTLRAQVREVKTSLADEGRLKGELDDLNKKLVVFEKSQHREVLQEYRRRNSQEAAVHAWEQELEEIASMLEESAGDVTAAFDASAFDSADSADAAVVKAIGKEQKKLGDVQRRVREVADSVLTQREKWFATKKGLAWSEAVTKASNGYTALLGQLEKEGAGSPDEYAGLVARRTEVAARAAELGEKREELEELQTDCSAALSKLLEHRRDLTKRRREFLSSVLADNRHVRINVAAYGDNEYAELELRSLLGRERPFFQNDIASPEGRGLLDRLYKNSTEDEPAFATAFEKMRGQIVKCAEGERPGWTVRDRRFVEHLRSLRPEIVDRLSHWTPEDRLEVSYSREVDGSSFEPIEQGSPGEKTAAILAFLLSYGDEPIVLDQPEDDLDNRLIYDLIVAQLRENKNVGKSSSSRITRTSS